MKIDWRKKIWKVTQEIENSENISFLNGDKKIVKDFICILIQIVNFQKCRSTLMMTSNLTILNEKVSSSLGSEKIIRIRDHRH